MKLRPGKILRFKGLTAQADLEAAAEELHGKCKRRGNDTLVITAFADLPLKYLNRIDPEAVPIEPAGNGAPLSRGDFRT